MGQLRQALSFASALYRHRAGVAGRGLGAAVGTAAGGGTRNPYIQVCG